MLVVRRLVEALGGTGAPRAELLSAAGLSEDALFGGAPVAADRVERMCAVALDHAGDPALGLRWVASLSDRTFAPVSHTLMHTLSLRQAFELLQQYQHLFCDRPVFELRESGDWATLRAVAANFRTPRMHRFEAEISVAGFFTMLRRYRPGASIERVCFAHSKPSYLTAYHDWFGDRVHFDAPYDGVVFERALLDWRNPHEDGEVRSALLPVLQRRLLREADVTPYAMRLRAQLTLEMPKRLGMAAAARKLGLAERSLRRRLMEEKTSFRAIQDEVAAAHAQRLLRHDRLSIQEAAHAMGFSDPSAFHRAFKRWTGRTPQTYREG